MARSALGTRPPKSLRKVPTEGVAYKGEDSRLETGVFTLASEKAAKKSLEGRAPRGAKARAGRRRG